VRFEETSRFDEIDRLADEESKKQSKKANPPMIGRSIRSKQLATHARQGSDIRHHTSISWILLSSATPTTTTNLSHQIRALLVQYKFH
jgi:hypothetical protein